MLASLCRQKGYHWALNEVNVCTRMQSPNAGQRAITAMTSTTSAASPHNLSRTLIYSPSSQQKLDTPTVTAKSLEDSFESAPVAQVNNAEETPQNPIVTLLCEFGKQLAAQPHTIGTSVDLGKGVALGLRLEGSVHTKSSSLVSDNPFRLASTTLLEKDNPYHSVVWSNTAGVTELGLGLNCTLPLSQFASLQFGFSPSALLRYRCIQPHVLGFFQSSDSVLKKDTVAFPFSSSAARKLNAGSEYELAGVGRVSLSSTLGSNFGTPSGTPISFGLGGSLFADETPSHEVALNVMSLDGNDKVRVSLRKIDTKTARAGARAYAGFSSQLATSLPNAGAGLLKRGAAWLFGTASDALIEYFATFSLQATTSKSNKDTVIGTFDFDLSDKEACEAYDALMRLSGSQADKLSCVSGSGVKQLKQKEKEHAEADEFSAALFGDKLILFQALKNEKDGRYTTPDGKTTLYRQANFKKHESGWFDPTRDVLWETVTLKDTTNDTSKAFFHFRYEKSGDINEHEYNDFFLLGQCLSLPANNGLQDAESKRLICQSLEANLTTDLYFTHDAIRSIAQTSVEQATKAFLELAGKLRPELSIAPLMARQMIWPKLESLLSKYAAECRAGWFFNFGHFDRLANWESKYQQLCGRSLEHDAIIYANAQDFAARIARIKDANDPTSLEQFFVSLGEVKGFAYQMSIATLATLAGDKDTLVHQHELKGNGLVFKYLDEGSFEEPSEVIKALLSKAL